MICQNLKREGNKCRSSKIIGQVKEFREAKAAESLHGLSHTNERMLFNPKQYGCNQVFEFIDLSTNFLWP